MIKNNTEEFYEKFTHFIEYAEKMKKNATKGHKLRFINVIIEFLKIKEKTPQMLIWLYYLLILYQKEINKYKKFVDISVAKKLDQLLCIFFLDNKYDDLVSNSKKITNKENIDLSNENKIINDNDITQKLKQDKKEEKLVDISKTVNTNNDKINKKDGGEKKIEKKFKALIARINDYDSVKDFILNSINKQNKNNKIFCEIYQLASTNICQERE